MTKKKPEDWTHVDLDIHGHSDEMARLRLDCFIAAKHNLKEYNGFTKQYEEIPQTLHEQKVRADEIFKWCIGTEKKKR